MYSGRHQVTLSVSTPNTHRTATPLCPEGVQVGRASSVLFTLSAELCTGQVQRAKPGTNGWTKEGARAAGPHPHPKP